MPGSPPLKLMFKPDAAAPSGEPKRLSKNGLLHDKTSAATSANHKPVHSRAPTRPRPPIADASAFAKFRARKPRTFDTSVILTSSHPVFAQIKARRTAGSYDRI
jgi:hypothetical protein